MTQHRSDPCPPEMREPTPQNAPGNVARIPAATADGYSFRSGDASEESGARTGESRQCAPAEEPDTPTCAICGRHGSTIIVYGPHGLRRECMACIDLETEDRGGPIVIVATIAAVVALAFCVAALLGGGW